MEIENENYTYYLPTRYIDNTFTYSLQDDYILINKNTNCHTQYTTTYCDCIRVYPNYNFISTNTFSCNIPTNNIVPVTSFSNDIYNFPNFSNLFIIYFIIVFIFAFILKLFFNVFRKRSV